MEQVRNKSAEDLPFFFIVGNGRSGTTLLRTLFDAHPSVNIPLECPLIVNLSFGYADKKDWNEATNNAFVSDLYRQRNFDTWDIPKDKLAQAFKTIQKPGFIAAVKEVYFNYSSQFRKEELVLLGDKTIVHAAYTSRLARIFKDARFIHLVRDPRDRNLSQSKERSKVSSTALKTFQWVAVQKEILKCKAKFPDRFLSIKYEDFVSSPQEEFKKICAFLHLPFVAGVFEYSENSHALNNVYDKGQAETWHKRVFEKINSDAVGRWKTAMSPRMVKISEVIAGATADAFGYERKCKKWNVGLFAAILPYHFLHHAFVLRRKCIDLLPFRLRNFAMGRGLLYAIYNKLGKDIVPKPVLKSVEPK